MPWLHLHVDTKGLVKACCNANITFGDINKNDIETIWNGEKIRKFRSQLKKGVRDNRCATCYLNENSGKASMRTETLAKYPQYTNWVDKTDKLGFSPQARPIFWDIRFNNLCNFKCRTCWHGASSSWFEEAKLLKTNWGDKAVIAATTDNEALITNLLSYHADLAEVYFAGGEPLMMQDHYSLLDRLVATGHTDVHLRYNTNLSQLKLKDKHVLNYWKQFEHVTVAVSIDARGDQGAYIRKGLDWELFIQNMKTIRSQLPHVQLQIAPTVSAFSIMGLSDLHTYFVHQNLIGADDIYINMLDRPLYYHIKILTKALKQKATLLLKKHLEWLEDVGSSDRVKSEFEAVLSLMNSEDWSHKWADFGDHISQLDSMRNESFVDVFPDFKNI